MITNVKKASFSANLIEQAAESLKQKQDKAIQALVDKGKYNKDTKTAYIRPINATS